MAERESRAVYWIAGALVAALLLLFLARGVESPFEPEPTGAYVALQPSGARVAIDGAHRLGDSRPFRLYAVLEATDWRGRTVYFTEAPALRIGGRDIAAGALRRWSRGGWSVGRVARVRWFTVDAFAPYLEVGDAADLDRFRLVETFRPEWGEGWSVERAVDPESVPLDPALALRPLGFGGERYAVRIELFDGESALTPAVRASSSSAAAASEGRGTSAHVALPPPFERLSLAFGRTEIAAKVGLPAPLVDEVSERIAALETRGLAFVEARLLAEHLAAAGTAAAELDWREFDLAAHPLAWGEQVGAGDLVQAGARVAILFRDQGEPGRLDPADLVIDLFEGATIRRLDQVFRGGAGLVLEVARVATKGAVPGAKNGATPDADPHAHHGGHGAAPDL